MDSLSLERIPLPSFTVYLASSLIALSAGIFNIVRDDWSQWKNISSVVNNVPCDASATSHCFHMVDKCLEDTWCFWSVTNFGYGCLMSFALKLQSTIFGQLTENEQTHIRDRFWNFVFYKIIFMYGVLKVQSIQEITLWVAWSSVLGFLYLLSRLLKDRLDFVLHMPTSSPILHLKITFLLLSVLALGIFLAGISLVVGLKVSLQIMLFMFAEVFQLFMSTMHIGTRYCLHFYLETQSSAQDAKNTLHRSIIFYYVDLFFDVLDRVVDLIHNLHMLFWNWLQITMSGLIICLHLQYLYYELSKIYKRHRRYCEVAEILSTKIPLICTQDKCAVCWDVLSPGRQLRCGHVFHDACLRSWIEHMPTCPTCRANIPDLNPPRDDAIQERELNATASSYVASPARRIPLPYSPTSAQQRQLQAAQPMPTANSFSVGGVSEDAVSDTLPTTAATFGSRTHELGSGLSSVVAQLADELSTVFAALNDRNGVNSSAMQHMSTTVIVNNLVDARHDLLPLRSLGTSELPVKFLGELEAELMTYLVPSESNADGASTMESLSLPYQYSEIPSPSAADPGQPSLSVGDPVIAELAPPLPSSPAESCEDSSEEESSPKKIVRQAIRVLLVRAGQAAEAAHRLRSMNRRRRRGKNSVCSSSPSDLFGQLPAGEFNALSPTLLEESAISCRETSVIKCCQR
uniref:E3 ubiquitin-protein ligase AMFR n=1 Tax=Schistocephalus solidus TaxID=70667 RepID=A0A0X3Q6B8_SCHSO